MPRNTNSKIARIARRRALGEAAKSICDYCLRGEGHLEKMAEIFYHRFNKEGKATYKFCEASPIHEILTR